MRTAQTGVSTFTGYIRRPFFHFYPRGIRSLILNAIRNGDKSILNLCRSCLKERNYWGMLDVFLDITKQSTQMYELHIWGHSWELEEIGLWKCLENFLIRLSNYYPESIHVY